jgi:hypothetical protein
LFNACRRIANTPITTISLNGPASLKSDDVFTRLADFLYKRGSSLVHG